MRPPSAQRSPDLTRNRARPASTHASRAGDAAADTTRIRLIQFSKSKPTGLTDPAWVGIDPKPFKSEHEIDQTVTEPDTIAPFSNSALRDPHFLSKNGDFDVRKCPQMSASGEKNGIQPAPDPFGNPKSAKE